MNKIVREHFPLDKVPAEFRDLLDPSRPITLVLEQPEAEPRPGPLTRHFGRFGHRDVTPGEAVARIRSLRDEWDL